MPLWLIPVLLRIFVANGLARWMMKKIAGSHSRTQRFFLQYVFCLIFSIIFAAAVGSLNISYTVLIIISIGFFNGFAAYCQWRAIDISLSRDSLFTFWDDIIGMFLAYWVLQEGVFINVPIAIGIILSIVSVSAFVVYSYRKMRSGQDNERVNLAFYVWVAIYSVIWGIATFAMRYLNVKNVDIGTFLWSWYFGAFVASSIILCFYTDRGASQQGSVSLTFKDWFFLACFALCIVGSLALGYTAYASPQVIVQPLFLTSEMIVPSLIGLYIFKEIKHLDKIEKLLFLLGITGGIFVAFGFNP